jgi:hypothetical protein
MRHVSSHVHGDEEQGFLPRYFDQADSQVKGMTCLLCQLDETVPQADKDLKWHRKYVEIPFFFLVCFAFDPLVASFNEDPKRVQMNFAGTCKACTFFWSLAAS